MPTRLHQELAVILSVALIAVPAESIAQRHGGRSHGGGWHGGGDQGYQRGYSGRYRYGIGYGGGYVGQYGYGSPVYYGYRPYGGYRSYGGYPGYYGYGGYYDDHHHHHNDGAWIAVGAGLLGVMLGTAISRPRVYHYGYPGVATPPPPTATQQCPDGSSVPVGSYCQAAPPPAPVPPMGERG